MARIKINFSGVQSANEGLKKTLRSIEQLEDRLSALQKQLDPEIQSRYGISSQLRSCRNTAASLENRARKLHSVASAGAQKYREAESRLNRSAPDNRKVTI